MFEQWEFEERWWKRRSWVHSLHMRGLLGHSAGVARLIIAAQSGIEYIYFSPSSLSTRCPRRRYISRCTSSALPVFVWNFYWICKWAAVSTSLRRAGRGPICVRASSQNLSFHPFKPPLLQPHRRVVSIAGSRWQNVNSLDYSGVVEEPIEARRMTLSSDTTSVRVSYVMLSSQASCARICVRDNACISGWRIFGREMLLMHYITLLHSSHIIKTAASVQVGLPSEKFSF